MAARMHSRITIAQIKIWFLILVFLVISLFIYYGPTDNWSWDPSFYYAQLRSTIIDRDLDLENDIVMTWPEAPVSSSGVMRNLWPVGPGLLWSPLFMMAHLIAITLDSQQANGISEIYFAFVSAGSFIFTILGLLIIYRALRTFTDRFVSLITASLSVFATPLLFYSFHQPIMAHTTSFFASALVVFFFLSSIKGRIPLSLTGLLFGISLGLAFLTRWSGLLLGIFPLTYYLNALSKSSREDNPHQARQIFFQIAIGCGVFLLIISPQLISWSKTGNLLFSSVESGLIDHFLLPSNFFAVLFSTNRGVFFWMPLFIFAFLGFFWIKDKTIKYSSLGYLLLLTIMLGYRMDWFGGGGFGARYYIEALPVLAVGFGGFANRLTRRQPGKVILGILSVILCAHQIMLVHSVQFGIEPGWIDLNRYWQGEPLGIKFQLESAKRLIKEPLLLFTPRPSIAQNRQTLIVNLLAGVTATRDNFIQLVALAIIPVSAGLMLMLQKDVNLKTIKYFAITLIIFIFLWSGYLLAI